MSVTYVSPPANSFGDTLWQVWNMAVSAPAASAMASATRWLENSIYQTVEIPSSRTLSVRKAMVAADGSVWVEHPGNAA